MTTENWINVAMVIALIITAAATLLGPILAVYAQSRISQPVPTPETNQLKKRSQTTGGRLQRALRSHWAFWLPWSLSTLFFIYALIAESLITAPLTRASVIRISLFTAALSFQLMSANARVINNFSLQIHHYTSERIDTLREVVKMQAEINKLTA